MELPDDAELSRSLLLEEFSSLRAESSAAKQNQQSILQWSLAAVGAIGVAAVAVAQIESAYSPVGVFVATLALGAVIPFITACAFGIWLGEVSRMERVGRFIRARERALRARFNSPVWSQEAAGQWPIMWESLIYDTAATPMFGKNRIGSWASSLLFAGIYIGSVALALVVLEFGPAQILNKEPLHPWTYGTLWTVLAAFLLFAIPLHALSARSHGSTIPPDRAKPFAMPIDVVMPCLNEGPALQVIAERMPANAIVTLADNGSTDGSQELARALHWKVISVERPSGVGEVSSRGLRHGASDVVCVMDSDGTVDPGDLASLLDLLEDGTVDMVVGARLFRRGSSGPIHRLLVKARATILRRRHQDWHLNDIGSVRVFRRSALPESVLDSLDRRNGWSLDLTLTAIALLGPDRVAEVRIPHRKRVGLSKITGTALGTLAALSDSVRVIRKHPRGPLHVLL